jgi:hypothetical protein
LLPLGNHSQSELQSLDDEDSSDFPSLLQSAEQRERNRIRANLESDEKHHDPRMLTVERITIDRSCENENELEIAKRGGNLDREMS